MTVDFSKINTINEIKNAKDGTKDVFDDEEKKLFSNFTQSDLDEARKAASLLVRIKKARAEKKPNPKLVEDLEDEEEARGGRGSKVYRVLNVDGLVGNTLNYLAFIGRTDFPKDKTARQAKITELEKEINDKRAERAKNEIGLGTLESELKGLIEDKEEIKKVLRRKNNLLTLLGENRTTAKLPYNGTDTLLSGIPISINNYSDPANPTPDATINTVEKALNHAETFLSAIRSTRPTTKVSPHETSLSMNYFNNRRYQTRKTLIDLHDGIGYGVLKALREIGLGKLERIVGTLTTTTGGVSKDDLKKYAKEIVEGPIHWHETIGGKGYNYHTSEDSIDEWFKKCNTWTANLLKREKTEYPYVKAPDWEHVFAFMNNVFPVNSTTGKLENKGYLFNTSDPNYLAPTDKDKGWSEIVFVAGFAETFPVTGTKSIGWYSEQPGVNPILKQQLNESSSFSKSADFAEVVQVWHDLFSPFNDRATNKWTTATKNEKIEMDYEFENGQNQLSFCLTMREIFNKLGLSSSIDEFDDYLITIASKAEEKANAGFLSTLTDWKSEEKGPKTYIDFMEAFEKKKVLNEDYNISRSKLISNLLEKDEGREAILDNEIDILKKKIGDIRGKSAEIKHIISTKKLELKALKEFEDISDKPLPDKKKYFNDLYAKKTDNKWPWLDVRSMIGALEMIKTGMEEVGEDFQGEYGLKETELNGIRDKVAPIYGNIHADFESIVNSTDDRLPSSGVKEILKKTEEDGKALLQKIAGYYQKLESEVILSDEEKDAKAKVNEGITSPEKYKDKPQEKEIELADFKTISVFANANEDLLKEWKDLPDSKGKYKKKSAIKALIDRVTDDTTKKGKFVEHIKDDSNATGTSDDEKLGNFFTKTKPKKVIETILTHEKLDTDDKKNNEKKKVKNWSEGSGDSKKVLNMKEYGSDKEDGEPSDEGVLKFLYEAEIGADHKKRNVSEKKDDGGNEGENGKGVLAHLKANWHWYGLAILAIIALLVVIFWKNISEWWNGPAEEEGKTEEDEKEEGEEND